ncbi:MAG TPA: efflux RND transporter periplasmic adaptor subunit [Woeseiaceae bacterium]|nr:efflux RND transporter periplasmic adaptor subunit [Woeseiaceae bacterium]
MRTRILLVILPLLALLAWLLVGNPGPSIAEPAPPPPPAVTVAEVELRPIEAFDEFTGRFEAVESVDIRPRVAGYVESVHFDEGAEVAEGDLLFQIDPRPFEAEMARLEAELARAGSRLELARSNHARGIRLFEQKATSREQLESLAAAESTQKAELAAVQAALEAAALNLEFTRVVSPIDGRVSRAHITAGNLVDSNSWLTTVVSGGPIHVHFDADEQTFLRYAGLAQDAGTEAVRVEVGLINEEGYPHTGRLDFIDNRVDPESGTIRGRAVLDNRDGRFTPGLFARIRLVGSETTVVAMVDDRAIGTDLDRKYVLVVGADNVAQYRGVEIGRFVDGLRVVTGGLEDGDVVIVNGLQRVRPGMPVTPEPVAMDTLARTPGKTGGGLLTIAAQGSD